MGRSLTALMVITLLAAGCTRPEMVPPSLPGPGSQALTQDVHEVPAEIAPSDEVRRLLGEIKELRRQEGTGIEIQVRIDQARSEAGHDAVSGRSESD